MRLPESLSAVAKGRYPKRACRTSPLFPVVGCSSLVTACAGSTLERARETEKEKRGRKEEGEEEKKKRKEKKRKEKKRRKETKKREKREDTIRERGANESRGETRMEGERETQRERLREREREGGGDEERVG